MLYELAREVFKKSSVSNEATVREPVVLGSPSRPPAVSGATSPSKEAADTVEDEGTSAGPSAVASEGSDEEAAALSAVAVLAAAENKSAVKKPKKETAAGLLRKFIKQEKMQENAGAPVGDQGGPPSGGGGPVVVTDGAIRQAVLDLIVAYTDKALRE